MATSIKETPQKLPAAKAVPTKAPFTKKTMDLFYKVCKERGIKPEPILKNGIGMPTEDKKSVLAYAMLCIIIKWINKDWVWDYLDNNYKYWTWHIVKADKKRPSGFGFSVADAGCDLTYSAVGARLYFGKKEDEQKWRKPLEELYLAYKL